MRKFVAACCCLIVGLQVLIGVPLVTCLVVLFVAGGAIGPVAVQVHPGSDGYQTPVPANFDGPQPYVSLPPADLPGPIASYSPAPVVATTAAPPSRDELEAIASARERIGSPLTGTVLEGPPEKAAAELVAVLQETAPTEAKLPPITPRLTIQEEEEEKLGIEIEPASRPDDGAQTLKPDLTAGNVHQAPHEDLLETLHTAMQGLYSLAETQEGETNFARADQIRQLAREIRSEMDAIRRETCPPGSPSVVGTSLLSEPRHEISPLTESPPRLDPPPAPPVEDSPKPAP